MALDEQVMLLVDAAGAALKSRASDADLWGKEHRAMCDLYDVMNDTVIAVHKYRKQLEDDR